MSAFETARTGKQKLWSVRTAVGVVSSAIMGGIAYGVFRHFGLSGDLLGSAIGMAGYIGPRAIDDIYAIAKQRMGKADK